MTKKIVYTRTDEAPALATYSFLPIVKAYSKQAGIPIEEQDISLAARVIAQFSDRIPENLRQSDALSYLGEWTQDPHANIIKLPNISASIPQLTATIEELNKKGYDLPAYPSDINSDEDKEVFQRYAKVLGSAVNPVLREGNSDRRVAGAVKTFAKNNPHSMGAWSSDSKTHVASMTEGDFFSSEKSGTSPKNQSVSVVHVDSQGKETVLKPEIPLLEGEVFDAAVMSTQKLKEYFAREIESARNEGILLSLHLKATMMKISDPILFGYAVESYFAGVFKTHASVIKDSGANPRNGLGDVLTKLEALGGDDAQAAIDAIHAELKNGPDLAMVNSDKGITNLHVPSDVIIDASMPAAIRSSGKMWGPDGKLHDTKALIPDRSYAGVYQETISFCQQHGAFDPSTMGNVSNVGLMAKKAEEYGSHDKTFEIPATGRVEVRDANGTALLEHAVEAGDLWRMCQTKDVAIVDWVKLAIRRAQATSSPVVFWLDENRAHDAEILKKLKPVLSSLNHELDTQGANNTLDLRVLAPQEATKFTLERVKEGVDTISATGNVLRDYLTDLFPILELGTSAKMLSIVPLLKGGGLYETGAGGSAPKHVEQLLNENHLRWDSLGEFLALAVSLEEYGENHNNNDAKVLAEGLNHANTLYLKENKAPSRKTGELDNRGSHFYVALYWAEAMAAQDQSPTLKEKFQKLATELRAQEQKIVSELNAVQGKAVDIDGYYWPSREKASSVMRPSETFNKLIDSF